MTHSGGIFGGFREFLFGRKRAGLSEHSASAHFLSYLLVVIESVTAVLVLGHELMTLALTSPNWVIRVIAVMALGILVASVGAADLALIRSFQRVPVLLRNRQSGAAWEHVAYILFVMLIDGLTYGKIIGILDSDPNALLSAQPIIPPDSPLFAAQIVLRAVLLGWTTVQLLIVVNPLPVQLGTLLTQAKSIVGAHLMDQLEAVDLEHLPLAASFRIFQKMAKPPRRVPTFYNGWLVARDEFKEREEERQAQQITEGLREADAARLGTAGSLDGASYTPPGKPRPALPAPRTPENPWPTGGGTPSGNRPTAWEEDETGEWPALDAREYLPQLPHVALNSETAATGQRMPGNTTQERAMQAYVNHLLDEKPLTSRKALRELLNVRYETAREYYNNWYYLFGGMGKIVAAKRAPQGASTDERETPESQREAAESVGLGEASHVATSAPIAQ